VLLLERLFVTLDGNIAFADEAVTEEVSAGVWAAFA
jgi:hypothetical protein